MGRRFLINYFLSTEVFVPAGFYLGRVGRFKRMKA
jgi:hypothetical protein